MKNILIIASAFNEEEHIREIINKCLKYSDNVLVIDDGSTDNTLEEVRKTKAIYLDNKINRGKGYSLKRGFDYAIKNKFKTIITIDADGQHDTDYIKELLKEIDNGSDVVIGTRLRKNSSMPKINRIANFTLSFIFSILSKQWIKDTQSGFRAFSVKSLKNIKLETNGYETETEVLIKLNKKGFKFVEVIIPTIYKKKYSMNFINDFKRFISILRVFKYHKNNQKRSLVKSLTTLKILRDRSMGWVSTFNFMMIGYLFLQNFEDKVMGIIIVAIGIVIVSIVTILDYIFILPKEQEYYLQVNKVWNDKMTEVMKKQ